MDRIVALISPRNAVDFTAKVLVLLLLFGLLNFVRDVLSYGVDHDSYFNNFNEAAFVGWPFAILALATVGHMQRLHEQLAHQAATDMLTGVPNRRAFMDAIMRPQPEGRTDVVMMVDIDHFKRINDTYGHACGDECLKTLAIGFRARLRPSDELARVGGEEFAILLVGTLLEDAAAVADRLSQGCDITMGDDVVQVTASVGYALRQPDISVDEVLKRADHAMYLAKSQGRACARFATMDPQDAALRPTVGLAS